MRTSYLGVAVLIVGLVAMSAGAATYVDAQNCRTVAGLSVTPVEDPPTNLTRVAYANLTDDQQRVFDQVRGARQALVQRGVFTEALVVPYEGTDYVVAVSEESSCGDPGRDGVRVPLLGGAALLLVGAGVAKYGS
ncbi:hypothetical protein [Haloglomus halophilum]|uniref:hypothetical protein n=1 Tax=Haloglomus halophilum TaxID=2962672 RepID=UPI0020C984F1|nr:hypothetical protein [Haloglomus halophilum]